MAICLSLTACGGGGGGMGFEHFGGQETGTNIETKTAVTIQCDQGAQPPFSLVADDMLIAEQLGCGALVEFVSSSPESTLIIQDGASGFAEVIVASGEQVTLAVTGAGEEISVTVAADGDDPVLEVQKPRDDRDEENNDNPEEAEPDNTTPAPSPSPEPTPNSTPVEKAPEGTGIKGDGEAVGTPTQLETPPPTFVQSDGNESENSESTQSGGSPTTESTATSSGSQTGGDGSSQGPGNKR